MLEKLKQLCGDATPGPWNNTDNPLTVMAGDRMIATCGYARSGQEGVQDTNRANAELIALSREAVPVMMNALLFAESFMPLTIRAILGIPIEKCTEPGCVVDLWLDIVTGKKKMPSLEETLAKLEEFPKEGSK